MKKVWFKKVAQASRLPNVPQASSFREAHHQSDLAFDRLYRKKTSAFNEERLEHLFELYEEMVTKEQLI